MKTPLLTVSTSPHIHENITIRSFYIEWLIALVPVLIMSIYLFGYNAIMVIGLSSTTALVAESIVEKIFQKSYISHKLDSLLIGILLGLLLPAGAPWWLPIIGSFLAVLLGKVIFGGLGFYPMNPVLIAWAALIISWPEQMQSYYAPFTHETSETPLMMIKNDLSAFEIFNSKDLWVGTYTSSLGTGSSLAILLGGLYLCIRRLIPWQIPLGVIIGSSLLVLFAAYTDSNLSQLGYLNLDQNFNILFFHLTTGGLLISAFFLGPEPVSSPITPYGMFLFGIGIGFMTIIVRMWGGPIDGAFYGVLIMNAATPLFDRIKPKVFGKVTSGF